MKKEQQESLGFAILASLLIWFLVGCAGTGWAPPKLQVSYAGKYGDYTVSVDGKQVTGNVQIRELNDGKLLIKPLIK